MTRLARAVAAVKAGGVIAYPTEAVYGLGCDPRNRAAVLRLLRLKRRPVNKGLILIAADARQLMPYVTDIPAHVRATWPGPVTWLLPARKDVPRWIRGRHSSIAVRVTAHATAAALCRAAGRALVSTSANPSRERPARSYRETATRLGAGVDYIVRGRTGGARRPTEIRDARTRKIVRAG